MALNLFERGCLWSSFVSIGSLQSLLRLIQAAADGLDAMYAEMAPLDLSRHILSMCPEFLTVLPMAGAGWLDLGIPHRARLVLRQASA